MDDRWPVTEIIRRGKLPETLVAPIDGAEMVLVPQGEFIMGISEMELRRVAALGESYHPIFTTEMPARRLFLKSYYIDRYPVTNYQYRTFVEATGHRKPPLVDDDTWGCAMPIKIFISL